MEPATASKRRIFISIQDRSERCEFLISANIFEKANVVKDYLHLSRQERQNKFAIPVPPLWDRYRNHLVGRRDSGIPPAKKPQVPAGLTLQAE